VSRQGGGGNLSGGLRTPPLGRGNGVALRPALAGGVLGGVEFGGESLAKILGPRPTQVREIPHGGILLHLTLGAPLFGSLTNPAVLRRGRAPEARMEFTAGCSHRLSCLRDGGRGQCHWGGRLCLNPKP